MLGAEDLTTSELEIAKTSCILFSRPDYLSWKVSVFEALQVFLSDNYLVPSNETEADVFQLGQSCIFGLRQIHLKFFHVFLFDGQA